MSGFDISYGRVDEATQLLHQQTEAVAKQIEDLDQKMQVVLADTAGETKESYQKKINSWRLNVDDMRSLLQKAEMALDKIRHNYSGTDRRQAMNWDALL